MPKHHMLRPEDVGKSKEEVMIARVVGGKPEDVIDNTTMELLVTKLVELAGGLDAEGKIRPLDEWGTELKAQ